MVTFSLQTGFEEATSAVSIAPLDNALILLQQFGFFRVILPFLLIWGIFYAILLKTKVLGDPAEQQVKNIAGVIATVAGFLFITYTPVVEAIAILLPQASFLLVVALLVLMTLAFIIPNWEEKSNEFAGYPLVALIIFVLLIFVGIVGFAVGENVPILYNLSALLSGQIAFAIPEEALNTMIALGLILGIPLAVIFFMVRGAKKDDKDEKYIRLKEK
ncbi:MAG: hypothetical protein AABW84_02310 [Nanoarchaeota archaeon]